MSQREPFVSVIGARKRFGPRVVLDDVSLEVGAGETVALIGPSGGGKSTLLRALNGLTPLDAGTIRIGTHRLDASESSRLKAAQVQAVRRDLGMIFQDFQLFPHLTVLQNVIEAPLRVLRRPRAEVERQARELLARVGLAEHMGAYPDHLSGGQKQRVGIARALAMEPRGLLCDEITSALDPELKHEVLEVLNGLRLEGMTLIVVTHEMGFARRAADRVVVLAGGKIIENGKPGQVFDDPQTERMKQFLRNVLI